MTGELSQLIWLTSAVNGFLSGRFEPGDFFPSNPVFHHCLSVQFAEGSWHGDRKVADDPRVWMAHLRQAGATRAFMVHGREDADAERKGEPWTLLVDYPAHREHWIAQWQSRHESGVNEKIWSVHYRMVHRGKDAERIAPADLPADVRALDAVLSSVRHFCAEKKLDRLAEAFAHVAKTLHGKPEFPEHVRPVCLSDYPEPAQRLLAAGYHAWASGQTHSWTDMIFERADDNRTHDSLSRLLHSAITQSVQDAVNSFGQGIN